jgi:hypothetical protein
MSGLMDKWIDEVVERAEEDSRVGFGDSTLQHFNGLTIK